MNWVFLTKLSNQNHPKPCQTQSKPSDILSTTARVSQTCQRPEQLSQIQLPENRQIEKT